MGGGRFIRSETESFEFRVSKERIVRDHKVLPSLDELLGFENALPQQLAVDGAFVYIEQGDVIVGNLVKLDEKLDEIRVRLLPERLLSLAEEVIQQAGDIIGQRVSVQIVVERVVAVISVQAG